MTDTEDSEGSGRGSKAATGGFENAGQAAAAAVAQSCQLFALLFGPWFRLQLSKLFSNKQTNELVSQLYTLGYTHQQT